MENIDCGKAREFLLAFWPTVLEEDFVEWVRNTDDDLIETENVLRRGLYEKFEEFLKGENDEDLIQKAWLSLNCIAFSGLNKIVMPVIYDKFRDEDAQFFEKCKILADMKVTAEQFGGNENHAIHFSAAVVELASLDNRTSPIEKFNCLSTTYDYIFAELKSVLIDIISKYSENETEIPIINNCEIRPVLMVVLIKSKPVHLASNLYYIENFVWNNKQRDHIAFILDSFKTAAEDLRNASEKTMRPPSGDVCRSLDLKGVIEMTSPQSNESVSVLKEQRDRISDLIICATNEANRCYEEKE